MHFYRITKPDKETIKLFIPYRKNFIYSSKTAVKQLARIIKTSELFYKVFDDNGRFHGCLFVDDIDHKNKIIEFGGFAARHANTKGSIRELMAFLKHYYPDYKIKAITTRLTAKISLTNAGLVNNKGDYIYE